MLRGAARVPLVRGRGEHVGAPVLAGGPQRRSAERCRTPAPACRLRGASASPRAVGIRDATTSLVVLVHRPIVARRPMPLHVPRDVSQSPFGVVRPALLFSQPPRCHRPEQGAFDGASFRTLRTVARNPLLEALLGHDFSGGLRRGWGVRSSNTGNGCHADALQRGRVLEALRDRRNVAERRAPSPEQEHCQRRYISPCDDSSLPHSVDVA